ncbi:MAG TPA: fibronectin type III domain-containing protein [Streptosporangiaceae bacterium]|nr:fibronectin type III domain-containing protein [Streptosporangiaceae bacterium]
MNAIGKKLFIAAAAVLAVAAAGVPTAVRASVRSAANVPGPPSGVRAVARDRGALVSWKAPSSDGGSPLTGYVIKASPGGATVRTSVVTAFLVGGLKNGKTYKFTVTATNKDGTGPASSPSAAVRPHPAISPGSPRSVAATAGFRHISVSWLAPRSDGGAPVTAYRLTTRPATSAISVSGSARSATLTGLANGKAYKVAVVAVNHAGRGKAAVSRPAVPHVTVPGVPAGVTAAPASSGVRVAWQPPVSNGGSKVTGYVITVRGTARRITTRAAARSVLITGLAPAKSHIFTVAAKNAKGTGRQAVSAPATGRATARSGVVVLSKASLSALTTVQTDGSLVFTSPPRQVLQIVAGDIVAAGVSRATSQGFLGQVTSVSAVGTTITVATVPAALDQALSSAGFGVKAALGRSQVTSFTPARSGVELSPAAEGGADCPVPDVSLSLKTNLYKDSNGRTITVDGSVCVAPSISFSASIHCCFHVASTFTGTVTAAASLSITAQLNHDFSAGYNLGFLTFDPIIVDVAGVPIVIVPTLSVKLVGQGSVSAGLTASAGESMTLGAKVTTSDAHVHAEPIASRSTSFTPPKLFGSVSAAAGIQANLSTKIDGLPGPTLTDTLWLAELTADPGASPWWALDLENILDVHYKLSILGRKLAEFQATLSDTKIRLAHAASPYQGITITPNPAAVAPSGQLQLHAQVAGAADQHVTWSAPPGNGSISASGLYTAPSAPGFYQVTATQPAGGLDPGATGLLSIQVGAQPPGPPTSLTASSRSFGAATLTWHPPADSGGSPITGYTITARPGGTRYHAPGSATSDNISGLTPGASYIFTITATNASGTSLPSPATTPIVIENVAGVLHSCESSGSISTLISGKNVISYVPKGSWDSSATGIDVVNVEGKSVTTKLIPTGTDVINSCASNSVTGQTVCTANNNDVYVLKGTGLDPSVSQDPLTDGGSGTISFSGGSVTTTGVSMDDPDNKALIALSVGGVGGYQFLDLSTDTFETAFATQDSGGQISEDPLMDPVHHLILSAAEDNNYELVNVKASAAPSFFEHQVALPDAGDSLDSSAEDCSTGIILAPAEFSGPSAVEIADVSKATFTPGSPGSWNAPEQVQTLTGSDLSAGPSGSAVAQGTTTGVVAGEFGGDGLTALALPATSGTGATPAIGQWVTCGTGSDPSGNSFSMGDDPHTLAAYQSPNGGDAIALLVNEGATEMVRVDLTSMLNPTIVPATGNVCNNGALPSKAKTFISLP